MSVTKSYNKYTQTYYAYETSYEWDEKQQKKVQKKICVGQFDPVTGEIIPNAKRGRPATKMLVPADKSPEIATFENHAEILREINALAVELKAMEEDAAKLKEKIRENRQRLENLQAALFSKQPSAKNVEATEKDEALDGL